MEMKRFISQDHFAHHLGIEVTQHGPGTARARMEIGRHHLNSAATAHGGAIFSLADAVFSVASNSHGTLAVAINVSISYFKAASEGMLYAEAEEVSFNPKLATYLIRIHDGSGALVALFQGTVYRKQRKLSELPG
jgi:acyl-CoA thioesterase